MEREEIGWSDPSEILPSVQGRTISDWKVDSEGLHLFLSDGSILIVMGVVCLMKNTSAH